VSEQEKSTHYIALLSDFTPGSDTNLIEARQLETREFPLSEAILRLLFLSWLPDTAGVVP
jgi:hypothetical protein